MTDEEHRDAQIKYHADRLSKLIIAACMPTLISELEQVVAKVPRQRVGGPRHGVYEGIDDIPDVNPSMAFHEAGWPGGTDKDDDIMDLASAMRDDGHLADRFEAVAFIPPDPIFDQRYQTYVSIVKGPSLDPTDIGAIVLRKARAEMVESLPARTAYQRFLGEYIEFITQRQAEQLTALYDTLAEEL